MTGLDWILVATVVLSVVAAVSQGFFFEVFSLAGTIFGYLLAAWEHWRLAPWFQQYIKSEGIANAAAFLFIFVCVVIVFSIAGKVTRWIVQGVGLSWVDRLLGGAFGLLRGMVMGAILVMAATAFAPQSPWLQQSKLSGYFTLAARSMAVAAPEGLKARF